MKLSITIFMLTIAFFVAGQNAEYKKGMELINKKIKELEKGQKGERLKKEIEKINKKINAQSKAQSVFSTLQWWREMK